jgi:hypothetical protein
VTEAVKATSSRWAQALPAPTWCDSHPTCWLASMAKGKRSTQQSATRPQGGHQVPSCSGQTRTNQCEMVEEYGGGVTVESVSSKLPFFLDRLTPFVGKGGVAAWPWPPDAAALSSSSGGLSAMIPLGLCMPVTLLNHPHLRLSPDSRSGTNFFFSTKSPTTVALINDVGTPRLAHRQRPRLVFFTRTACMCTLTPRTTRTPPPVSRSLWRMTRVLASIVALLLVLSLELPNTLASSAADDWPQHPTWEPTYDMAKSSIMMVRVRPCAYFGRFQLPPSALCL